MNLDHVLAALPADEPAPGVEVDVTAAGVATRATGEPRQVSLADDEIAALRAGLEALAGDGDQGAAALLARWPPATGSGAVADEGGIPETAETLVLRVAPALASWLGERVGDESVQVQRDGSALWSVGLSSRDGLLPWLLRLGPRVEILGPRPLRAALIDETTAWAERYRTEPEELPPLTRPD